MLEYVTWEQVLVVLFVGLWLLRTIQVVSLKRRTTSKIDSLKEELGEVLEENAAMRAKLHSTLDAHDYDCFTEEFL